MTAEKEKRAYEKAKTQFQAVQRMNLEEAKKIYEAAKARFESARAKESQKARKLDTRRKIIIGGILLKEAEDDLQLWDSLEKVLGKVTREIDKTAFKDWEMPAPPGEASDE